jgi:HAD superfamily hydrolase (TIGR01459 family)
MLQALSSKYPVWFCDVWGVVHNGAEVYPPAADSLTRHREGGGTVILVSNSPRSTQGMALQLDETGVPRGAYDAVVTSGDVTRDLMLQTDGKLFHIGPDRDDSLFARLAVERVSLEKASAVIGTGFVHEERETAADYDPLLRDMLTRGLPMICANPDKVARKAGKIVPCAGALAERYGAMGGEVRMAGKPHAPIYDLARRRAAAVRDHDVPASSILCIGDGPETDVAGAAAQGMACLFVFGLHDGESEDAAAAQRLRKRFPTLTLEGCVHTLAWRQPLA